MTAPSPASVAAEKARILLAVGRNEDAGKAARDGLRSEPNNVDLLGLLALALSRDGHASDAQRWAERALSFDPQRAWIHNVRAHAILDGNGHSHEAVESAQAAVRLDQHEVAYRYTLTDALLEAGRRGEAETVARSIRGVDPNSALGPLAEALVELKRVRFLVGIRWYPVAILAVIITNGLALLGVGFWWLVVIAQRTVPLRRADKLLLEALKLDPVNPSAHSLVAEVAQLRFRYIRSVDAALAVAAIDAGLVDADKLARKIARRTFWIAVAAFLVWFLFLAVFWAASTHVFNAVGIGVGLVAIFFVCWIDRMQTVRLPAGLVRRVRRRWGVPVIAWIIAVYVIYIGLDFTSDSAAKGFAAFVPGFVAMTCAAVATVELYAARRG